MILQALKRHYEILSRDPRTQIAPFGYSTVGVSFALNISAQGELLDVLPQFSQEQRGKRMVDVPMPMVLPQRVKRSANVAPNFLWDNTVYVLGISKKDDTQPDYSRTRFEAFRKLHTDALRGIGCEAASALIAFLEGHDPSTARDHPAVARHLDTLLGGGNLVFLVRDTFVHEDPDVRAVWKTLQNGQETALMQCLVTGEMAGVARLHPSLKGVLNAQSSGATLVGFNAPAYESYGRAQGLNAPVSGQATFEYTTAINHLLSDANPNRKFYLGDSTVVYWAESENRKYESAFASIVEPEYVEDVIAANQVGRRRAETALQAVTEKVRRVQLLDLDALLEDLQDENPRFFILGLAPNAARVSVRFFITDPFESVVQKIMAHYRDMEIVKEFENQPDYVTVRRILYETISKKATEKSAGPLLAGAVFRAILTNSPYPAALYTAIVTRIRADMDDGERGIRKINYVRAAVIKAFLIRKYRHRLGNPFKEVLQMSLNEESTSPAYVLGRLFAVLEKAQKEAVPDAKATIKDRYFTSACASPSTVFPVLLRLSQHHISKAEYGYASDNRIEAIMSLLDVEQNPIPKRLTLDEQGVFVLGYYHQRAAFYVKKDNQADETDQSEDQ